ncbi:hypothetical protein Kpol_1039p34 [Vanderwaltozyma polyspora DSM 70294]|uniref:Uncharacterized protein n=1 Tax=Vanderwaltozyma polyspora (strain ATCC 22028 / DSM 70294 / BCRC 21397 / CBS 2163 / NBRC 10782 / NRRL Y-8283 / UCD 57-17) TaxID=436907 RepID=A7THG1_VANPO|nr:uncharacterized protein Kpol_1039p34 [Vanderwaltozyma polyspora DSM 70294]EDO18285.1 hypothetical protein Kpol_1039p34 [Vanderwaltozyma polyspora DSM 70294]
MKNLINEPSTDFHIKLNEQSFKIPTRLLKKNNLQLSSLIESETKELQGEFLELQKLMNANNLQDDKLALAKMNDIIKNVDMFEKKLNKKINEEMELLNRIQTRINFFEDLESAKNSGNESILITWYQKYTNVLIGDYLTRNSSINNTGANGALPSINMDEEDDIWNTGTIFLKQQHLEKLLDYDILINANKISKALTENHDLQPLFTWIQENKHYLSRRSCTLNFDARLQEYIQLLRLGKKHEAIYCFQTYLIPFISTNLEDLKRAAGLLLSHCSNKMEINVFTEEESECPPAFNTLDNIYGYFFHKEVPRKLSEKPSNKPDQKISLCLDSPKTNFHSSLFDDNRWAALNEAFLEEYYKMYGISHNDPLLIYLSLGISTLKTRDCIHSKELKESMNIELDEYIKSDVLHNKCPVCTSEFRNIAKDLPFAHHIQSELFENPVMLPNGNVYDMIKLVQIADNIRINNLMNLQDDEIIDPINKEVYKKAQFIKMYPT